MFPDSLNGFTKRIIISQNFSSYFLIASEINTATLPRSLEFEAMSLLRMRNNCCLHDEFLEAKLSNSGNELQTVEDELNQNTKNTSCNDRQAVVQTSLAPNPDLLFNNDRIIDSLPDLEGLNFSRLFNSIKDAVDTLSPLYTSEQ